jgi:hypothetical protein
MKKYTANIDKLYEAEAGFEKLEAGKAYTSKKGTTITIKSMVIDANSMVPDVFVNYKFETIEGQRGEETNRFTVVVDMLRNS